MCKLFIMLEDIFLVLPKGMSRSFVKALTFSPRSITSNNRNVIVRRKYGVTCLPGLHIAVSIVDPELASFGHFSHYLDSPYSVGAGMTSSSSWRNTRSTTTGVLTHPQSSASTGTRHSPGSPYDSSISYSSPTQPAPTPTPKHRRRDAHPRAPYESHSQRHLLFTKRVMQHLMMWQGRQGSIFQTKS